MAKWKMASHMAVAMREAEKQAEIRRILEEQRMESVKNGTILRSMERNRAVVGRRAKGTFVKGERVCNYLTSEHLDKTWDVHVASSPYYLRQDKYHHEMLLENIEKADACVEEAKKIRAAIHLVHLKERETDAEYFSLQLKLKKLNVELANVHVISPEKVTGRMEVAHQQYGMQLEENRRLVDQLNHLEGERDKVLELHKELERDLEELSKQLAGYLDEAKTTYEQRDMNKRNMAKLREHLEKSTGSYESDMQLLQFKIDVLKRMERFMTTKNKFRPDEGKERRRENRSHPTPSEKDTIMFSSLMSRIRSDLQEEDLHAIIKTFIELEEENYMLFKNISETRDSCHTMQVEISEIREKIAGLRRAKHLREQESMAHRMELLEKIQICNKEASKKEECIAQANKVISTYIKGILAILDKLGYTEEEITRLAGVFKSVEERNIRVFLAEIERYVNQLYDVKTTSEFLVWEKSRKMSMTNPPVESLPPRLTLVQRVVVVPPQHEEGDDIDDPALPAEAAFRPLSFAEVSFHVDEDLESRAEDEQQGLPIPVPTMTDPTSEAIGDSPHPCSPTHSRVGENIDVF